MELKGRSILVLGGAGLVGKAVCRHLIVEAPAHIIVSARTRDRAEAAADLLRRAVLEGTRVSSCWGNIFVRWELKDAGWNEILSESESRRSVLLRGPIIKADNAHDGWVDLRPENMRRWQDRLAAIGQVTADEAAADGGAFSSRFPGLFRDPATGEPRDDFDIGEIVGWILTCEDRGARMK